MGIGKENIAPSNGNNPGMTNELDALQLDEEDLQSLVDAALQDHYNTNTTNDSQNLITPCEEGHSQFTDEELGALLEQAVSTLKQHVLHSNLNQSMFGSF